MRSPFFNAPESAWIASNALAFAIFDAHPVTPGHALVVTRRLVPTWWEAAQLERLAVLELVDVVRARVEEEFRPAGFNVGFNAGEVAGQTVAHLHVHVIPRYPGDVDDPRGGVRWVIPAKANYLRADIGSDVSCDLATATEGRMLSVVRESLATRRFDHVDLVVSFIMRSGVELIETALRDAIDRGARVRVLTTDYLNITDSRALLRLLDWSDDADGRLVVRVFHDPQTSFHPKGYVFWSSTTGEGRGIVGSSNLSRSGLSGGEEWNLVSGDISALRHEFDRLWADPRSLPLTREWLREYRHTRPSTAEFVQFAQVREPSEAEEPTPIQREALDALRRSRADGYGAGLVVMATGLGKTYLAAFDTTGTHFGRVLFVAHREEILRQSRDVFRRVHGHGDLGLFFGKEKTPDCESVFAGVQTLAGHLDDFAADAFDYIVVDEFHHAAASSYRKVIDHFSPKFLLGLTATPERMDGADLLALCADNLVYQCDLVEGIRRKELCPFEYHGIRDVVDFAPIPWRNGKFDPEALTRAVETVDRADQALREWRERGGSRTLAFCCSITHADFMSRHFQDRSVRAVAVHSGESSAPRRHSVERLADGKLDVLFAVDVFNEGLDVPAIDTVLMLRPTESPVIFLQQLGRGLRRAGDAKLLKVIDFIGNHRSFLVKPRTLLSLGARKAPSPAEVLRALKLGEFDLPAGCSVSYELDVIQMLDQLTRTRGNALELWCRETAEETGFRPTAGQAFRSGYNPGSVGRTFGGWFGFLDRLGLTTDDERRALDAAGGFLRDLETEAITKSYKLITLRALIHEGALLSGLDVSTIASVSRRLICRDPRLLRETHSEEFPDPQGADDAAWAAYWRRWPIAAWLGELRGGRSKWFGLDGDRFSLTIALPAGLRAAFEAMVAELVEWRLSRHLSGKEPLHAGAIRCVVSHSSGNPIIRFPTRERGRLPEGTGVRFLADGDAYEGDFVKIALNVARSPGRRGNALHALLRGWFGPSAGLPGTTHHVIFESTGDGWVLRRAGPAHPDARDGGAIVPLYPTYAVACGAFGDASGHEPAGPARTVALSSRDRDTADHFVVFARGHSMDGGPQPIRHGDPLLLRWVRDESLRDLDGTIVLVEKGVGAERLPALKRLCRSDGRYVLKSSNPGERDLSADRDCRVVARFVRLLEQIELNPVAEHLHQDFKRADIPALYGEAFNAGKWNAGHVSLGDRVVMLTTLNKSAMAGGSHYEDHIEAPDELLWSSQTSTKRESKRGREIIDCLDQGIEVHMWLRRRKSDVAFTYAGQAVPLETKGERPIEVRWRLLTPLPPETYRRLGGT